MKHSGWIMDSVKREDLKGPSLNQLEHEDVASQMDVSMPTCSIGLAEVETRENLTRHITLTQSTSPDCLPLQVSQATHVTPMQFVGIDSVHPSSSPITDGQSTSAMDLIQSEPLHSVSMHSPQPSVNTSLASGLYTSKSDLTQLRLPDHDLPHLSHTSDLRLSLSSSTDYSLPHMYSMSSILASANEPTRTGSKHDSYSLDLSRTPANRFGGYSEEGRLPGISYMMSTQEGSLRAAGLDLTVPSIPSTHTSSPPLDIQSSLTHPPNAFPHSSSQIVIPSRAYRPNGADSDSDSELNVGVTNNHLTEAQERFASHLGRMDMKSIIEATKLAVAQQHLNQLAPGDVKQHCDGKDDGDTLSTVERLGVNLSSIDVQLASHQQDHELSDMAQDIAKQHAHNSNGSHDDRDVDFSTEEPKRNFDKRKVHGYLLHEFPWLVIDNTLNAFFCRYCMVNGNDKLAKGVPAGKLRKEGLVKHEQSMSHQDITRKFLGLEPIGSQQLSHSLPLPLDSVPLSWPSTSSKFEDLHPPPIDSVSLTNVSSSPGIITNTGIDTGSKPLIIDLSNSHTINHMSSGRSLAETRAQFEGWFEEFQWLIYDAPNNLFQCKTCQNAGMIGSLGLGKSDSVQKSMLQTHADSISHQEALKSFSEDDIIDRMINRESNTVVDVDNESNSNSGYDFRTPRICQSWFKEFPWLDLNQMDLCFYCKLCRLYKQQGIFCVGKPALNSQKDDLICHENTEGHKIASLQDAGIADGEAIRAVLSMHDIMSKDVEKAAVGKEKSSPSKERMKGISSSSIAWNANAEPSRLVSMCGETENEGKIMLEWFIEFPWLELDEKNNVFYCKLCRIYHPIGIYVSGKSASNPKKDDLRKHEDTEGHKIAVYAHSKAGVEGKQRLEKHSLDPSNAHLIDITTVSQITHGLNKTTHTDVEQCMSKDLSINYRDTSVSQEQSDAAFRDAVTSLSSAMLSASTLDSCFNQDTTSLAPVTSSSMNCSSQTQNHQILHSPMEAHAMSSVCHTTTVTTGSVTDALISRHVSDFGASSVSENWSSIFPWYHVDAATQMAHCKACRAEGLSNALAQGVPVYVVMKKDCVVHEKILEHQGAMQKQNPIVRISKNRILPQVLNTEGQCQPQTTVIDLKSAQSLTQIPTLDCIAEGATTLKSSFWDLAEQMRHLGVLCDITLSAGAHGQYKYYHAHKLILVCSSDFFKAHLRNDTMENHYHFDNVTSAGLEGLLRFMYRQPLTDLSQEGKADCLSAAKILEMSDAEEAFLACKTLPEPPKENYANERKRSASPENVPDPVEESVTPDIPDKGPVEDPKTKVVDWRDYCTPISRNGPNGDCKNGTSVKSKTDGQLAKKPSIIGRLKTKDKIKAFASTNNEKSKQIRAKKTKGRREIRYVPVNRKNAKGTKNISETDVANSNQNKTLKDSEPKKPDTKETKLPETNENTEITAKKDTLENLNDEAEKAMDGIEEESSPTPHKDSNGKKMGAPLPTCDVCGKRFLRPAFLVRHKELKHRHGKETANNTCDTCGKGFTTKYDLKVHTRRHTGERPYNCTVCGKTFTRRETLIEHSYIHKPDSEKPHQCEQCGKGFYKIYDLQRHFVGIHSGAKPFQCHLCGKSFPWARSLSDHLQSHQGADRVRPYKCEECDMNFRRKYDLDRHRVKHAAQKPFECEWCGHGFTQKGSMDKHKREFCHGRPGVSDQACKNIKPQSKPEGEQTIRTDLTSSTQAPIATDASMMGLPTPVGKTNTDIFPDFSSGSVDHSVNTSAGLTVMYKM